jgi:hypothetical protein
MSQAVLAWVKATPSGAVAVACPVTGPHARALVKMGAGMDGVVTMSSLEGGLWDPSALTATTCKKEGPNVQHLLFSLHQLHNNWETAQHSTAQHCMVFYCTFA